MTDLQLKASMARSGRGTHNDLAVTIGFNSTLEPGEVSVSQKFGPTPQVKCRLHWVWQKFNRQRCHDLSLPLRRAVRQLDAMRAKLGSLRQFLPQQGAHPHPFGEGVEAKFLV